MLHFVLQRDRLLSTRSPNTCHQGRQVTSATISRSIVRQTVGMAMMSSLVMMEGRRMKDGGKMKGCREGSDVRVNEGGGGRFQTGWSYSLYSLSSPWSTPRGSWQKRVPSESRQQTAPWRWPSARRGRPPRHWSWCPGPSTTWGTTTRGK